MKESDLSPIAKGQQWRPIPSLADAYEVSDDGRVRRGGRELAIRQSGRYAQVSVCVGGRERTCLVHSLVAEAFIGPKPHGLQVNLDGNRRNNAPDNLEYVTAKGNTAHALRTGLAPVGERNGSRTKPASRPRGERNTAAKLTAVDVLSIRRLRAKGETLTAIAERFGIVPQSVLNIVERKTWQHIS